MQKIGNLTDTSTSDGEFTDGNVAGGVSPTILTAAWFNTIQRELVNAVEGGGLSLDPSLDAQLLASIKALISSHHGLSSFTSSGQFTVPEDIFTVYLSGCAAGGGGGGGLGYSSGYACNAGGGGAGQSVIKYPVTVNPGDVIAVTIGAAGSSGSAGNVGASGGTGGSGGNTLFGSLLTLTGGSGGGGGVSGTNGAMGVGYPNGEWGIGYSTSDVSGNFYPIAGCGGSGPFGGGGPGGHVGSSGSHPGNNAGGYGAGGGGGGGTFTSGTKGGVGGAGSAGFLVVEW